MPGVGKSTIGVLLAKVASRDFIDTDVYIQANENRRLQQIIDTDGLDAFCAIEERYIGSLSCRGSVIATGGSVVYSERAMAHLKTNGLLIHLNLPLPLIEKRLTDLGSRGVVIHSGQTLAALFAERQPLYQRYADITVDTTGMMHEDVVRAILSVVQV